MRRSLKGPLLLRNWTNLFGPYWGSYWSELTPSKIAELNSSECHLTICIAISFILKEFLLTNSWTSTLWQLVVDHACFSGRGCLLLDLSQLVPIQDLCVTGKVKNHIFSQKWLVEMPPKL